ncbi:MAG: hypothetical protein ACI81W_003985, partial [Saprospiraceae bacterium]
MNRVIIFGISFLLILLGCKQDNAIGKDTKDPSLNKTLFTLLSSDSTGIKFVNHLKDDVHDETKNVLS